MQTSSGDVCTIIYATVGMVQSRPETRKLKPSVFFASGESGL